MKAIEDGKRCEMFKTDCSYAGEVLKWKTVVGNLDSSNIQIGCSRLRHPRCLKLYCRNNYHLQMPSLDWILSSLTFQRETPGGIYHTCFTVSRTGSILYSQSRHEVHQQHIISALFLLASIEREPMTPDQDLPDLHHPSARSPLAQLEHTISYVVPLTSRLNLHQ